MRAASRAVALWLMLIAPVSAPAAAGPPPGTVNPANYDAFWLWAGVKPRPYLARARRLYLLRGEVSAPAGGAGPARLIAQGGTTPHLHTSAADAEVWIVYRAHTLDWPPGVYARILGEWDRWREAGDPVAGIQIDFDARTRRLGDYARFLADLRARLPKDCKLSVTGLLDWSRHADPAALSALGGAVDEVVLQTYQGRRTIPGYAAYLARLGRLTTPFRIGLVEGGDWTVPRGLAANPRFRGYVVFLVNERHRASRG